MNNQNSHPLDALELSEKAISWLESKRVRTIEDLISLMLTSKENHELISERIGLSDDRIEILERQAGIKLPTPGNVLSNAEKDRIKQQYPMGAEPEKQEPDVEGGENEYNP